MPFAPGGGNDIVARIVAEQIHQTFGQTGVVDNRAGAGSTIGTDIAAKAVPDGYTLLVTHNAIAINETLYPKLPYDADTSSCRRERTSRTFPTTAPVRP